MCIPFSGPLPLSSYPSLVGLLYIIGGGFLNNRTILVYPCTDNLWALEKAQQSLAMTPVHDPQPGE